MQRGGRGQNQGPVLIVGAGLAGTICAQRLVAHDFDVSVFEKSRGPGGRQSTRREDFGDATLHFDHGAQYFTVRDPEFARFLDDHRGGDVPVVVPWTAPVVSLAAGQVTGRSENTDRYVCTPGMNALAKRLTEGLDVRYRVRVHACERTDDGWLLRDEGGQELATGSTLVLTAPAEQALALLPEGAPFRDTLANMRYAPSWTIMVHFPRSLGRDFGGAFVDRSALAWIANNDSKPGRNPDGVPGESWVLHASPEWSYAHFDDDPGQVTDALLGAFEEALGVSVPTPDLVRPHRWRYALPTVSAGSPSLWDDAWRLAVAGDGCPDGARVEGAFLSGWTAARRIRLDRDPE